VHTAWRGLSLRSRRALGLPGRGQAPAAGRSITCGPRLAPADRSGLLARSLPAIALLARSGHAALSVRLSCSGRDVLPCRARRSCRACGSLTPKGRSLAGPGCRAGRPALPGANRLTPVPIAARRFGNLPPGLRPVGPLAGCAAGRSRSPFPSLGGTRAGLPAVAARNVRIPVFLPLLVTAIVTVTATVTGDVSGTRETTGSERLAFSTRRRSGLGESTSPSADSASPVSAGLLTVSTLL
jgi:hypothetical protein